MDNVELARKAWSHFIEKRSPRDASDYTPFFESLADDVVWKVTCPDNIPVFGGERHGKQAVVDLFTKEDPYVIDGNDLERPPEFFSNRDKVVMLFAERYDIKKDGRVVAKIRNKESVFVMEFQEGLIKRILLIADLSEWIEAYRTD